jgi:cytochrome c oxidase assembly protein subunit 15
LHAWAVLTVLATLPLLFLGAEVTTKGVGMADPVGYRHPWELLQILLDTTGLGAGGLGLQIEYSHRIAGFTVGLCAIVLAAGLWLGERRRWVCWVGTLALALVCVQGLLGRYRVDLNALFGRDLALVHGCFAQLVIAALVSVAVFTSRGWVNDHPDVPARPALRRWSLLMVLLVYGQLVLGGVLRHKDFPLGSRLHLAGAFVVVGAVFWLVKVTREGGRPNLALPVKVLVGLVAFQVLLGIEAWLGRAQVFFRPGEPLPDYADWLRSAHYVVGTLVFATSVVIALKANRRPVVLTSPAPARTLEGAL